MDVHWLIYARNDHEFPRPVGVDPVVPCPGLVVMDWAVRWLIPRAFDAKPECPLFHLPPVPSKASLPRHEISRFVGTLKRPYGNDPLLAGVLQVLRSSRYDGTGFGLAVSHLIGAAKKSNSFGIDSIAIQAATSALLFRLNGEGDGIDAVASHHAMLALKQKDRVGSPEWNPKYLIPDFLWLTGGTYWRDPDPVTQTGIQFAVQGYGEQYLSAYDYWIRKHTLNQGPTP